MKKAAFLSLVVLSACLPSLAPAQESALPVKTVEFRAESVGRTMKYNVVLPAKYEQSKDRYPVLYLLHGLTGNYTNWGRMGVPQAARAYDLIVVMPDAGNSWYVNWAKSDEGQKNNWEDYIAKDLVTHVDATYRTLARREGRAINGLSMGGYGGLLVGLKHPELFCSVGSHSGAIAYAKQIGERLKNAKEGDTPAKPGRTTTTPGPSAPGGEGFSTPAERTPKGRLFVTADDAFANDPFAIVLKLPREKLPHIYVDCGTEDFLYQSNKDFVKLLIDNKIPFTYGQSGGGHTPQYWGREVGHSMAVQYAVMQRQLGKK